MRIKEVEEQTGLTAKAIRLYESKGLLNVARNTENDYRDYSDEDVKQLKMVAFLREMDISIQGIKDWVDGKLTIQDLMRYTAGQANDAENAAKLRCELAQEVLRLMEADPHLNLLEAMEDVQTLRKLKQEIKNASDKIRGNLVLPVMISILSLGPIGWTVIHILMDRTQSALAAFGISIVALIVVFIVWSNYFRVTKEKRNRSGCLPSLLLAVVAFVIVIGLLCFVALGQKALFATDLNSLILFRYPWVNILLLVPILEIILPFQLAQDTKESEKEVSESWKQRVIGWVLAIAFNLVILYGAFTATTVCDSTGFTRHSFFNPTGKHYTLEDIERVEVGFYGNSIPILSGHQSGDFYYKITFEDGRTEDWAQASPADDDRDSWEALLELDERIMSMDVEKISNDKNRDKAFYDQECLDIFDAILNNR